MIINLRESNHLCSNLSIFTNKIPFKIPIENQPSHAIRPRKIQVLPIKRANPRPEQDFQQLFKHPAFRKTIPAYSYPEKLGYFLRLKINIKNIIKPIQGNQKIVLQCLRVYSNRRAGWG